AHCARTSACHGPRIASSVRRRRLPSDAMMAKSWLRLLVLAGVLCSFATPAAAQSVGIVLMHGKWGTPDGPTRPVEMVLRGAGYHVIAREMAWSHDRAYDETFIEIMVEIGKQVVELKAGGAQRVVVAGQSLGANMALAFGARHPQVDGVMVLAPGHMVERY